MYDATSTIRDFLDAAAAKQPAPGGGSVTALAGALAASMGEMVVNYSIGKKSLAPFAGELAAANKELTRARSILLELMAEDQTAFETLSALKKLPESSPERWEQFPVAALACIRVPEAMAATALAVLDLCDRLTDKVNHYLLSDLAVCAELSMATVRCGSYNVRVNLTEVAASDRRAIEGAVEQMLSRATEVIRRVVPRIWARHAKGA